MKLLLTEYPLLLLFIVASLGYLLGSIKIKSSSLGVAAVLFVGLAFGAIYPGLEIPRVIFLLGLSIFVYSVGLNSGPAFFESYKRHGYRDFLFIICMLVFSGLIASALWLLFDFSSASITGAYAGSTTNTAALAGVLDLINGSYTGEVASQLNSETVVGYSFSYPMGVIGGMIGILLFEKVLKIDYEVEKKILRKSYSLDESLSIKTIEILNPDITNMQLRDLNNKYNWDVAFGRIFRNEKSDLIHWNSSFQLYDKVMITGAQEEIDEVEKILGKFTDDTLAFDRSQFDSRRIFVSNPVVAGKTIAALNLHEKYNTVITRIRRGDIDMVANANTVLELGDRVRFIARIQDLEKLSKYFGDSYQASSKVNLFSFGLGIGLGLLIGTYEFNFGPDLHFKLGYAGGPLIVGLLLGALKRTGPILWTLPYSANVTLQQMGLIFLLSAIGVSSGSAFINSITYEGLCIILASAVISLTTAFSILYIGYKWVKIPFSLLMGMVANQPAILDFALSRSNNRIPMYGFAIMFPLALIIKILIAQIMFLVLS